MAAELMFFIPKGCICLGDGLFGMKCEAEEHFSLAICSDCGQPGDSQHLPSCQWQGLVTAASDHRERDRLSAMQSEQEKGS